MKVDMTINEKIIKDIATGLKDEKQKLEAQLALISTKNVRNPSDYNATFPDFGTAEDENAAEVATFSDNLTLERTLESALRDVNKTLERIAAGNYGTCRHCSKEIDEKRLQARPTSSSCIDCKKRLTLEG